MVNVAIVGTGFVATSHVAGLKKVPSAKIVGVVDAIPERAQRTAAAAGAERWSTDYREMLRWDHVDVVHVCTPNFTHAEIAVAAAAQGKHVLIEKPLATTLADADRIIAAADAAGTKWMAAHTHRFYTYGRRIKQLLDRGDLGRGQFVRYALLGGFWGNDWNAWHLDPAKSGGHVLHNGVHLLDLVTWWLGEAPVSVFAQGRKISSSYLQIYDYFTVTVEYASGAGAIIEMSRASVPRSTYHRDILITGSSGTLQFRTADESAVLFSESGASYLLGEFQSGFDREMAAWIGYVEGSRGLPVPAEAARLSIVLSIAAERSLETGAPVYLSDVEHADGR